MIHYEGCQHRRFVASLMESRRGHFETFNAWAWPSDPQFRADGRVTAARVGVDGGLPAMPGANALTVMPYWARDRAAAWVSEITVVSLALHAAKPRKP